MWHQRNFALPKTKTMSHFSLMDVSSKRVGNQIVMKQLDIILGLYTQLVNLYVINERGLETYRGLGASP